MQSQHTKISRTCPHCQRVFLCYPSQLTEYCSVACRWDAHGQRSETRNCERCGKPFFAKAARIRRGKGRFCSPACSNRASGEQKVRASAARFWTHVERQADDGCWLWQGACTKTTGYGMTTLNGKKMTAHRASYIIAHGAIPDDLWVLHHCDNRPCVRPDHLFLGTHQDNMDDAKRKGRRLGRPVGKGDPQRQGSVTHPDRVPRGERNGGAKITAAQVRELRRRYAAGGISQTALAAAYGIDQTEVSLIVRRKHWAHVTDDQL